VRFREALANSYNIAAVDLLNQIGVEKFYNFLQDQLELNFAESANELGLSLVLGSGSTSLLNLTRAFSVFTHQGNSREIQFLEKVLDENNEILWRNPLSRDAINRVFKTNSAEWAQHVLSDNQARWKNFSRGNSLELDFPSGAKTGTSQEFKDNWVVGFSRDFTVGVWVGNADGSAMFASSGMQGAGPIWQKIMQLVNQNPAKNFEYSGNRREKMVCRRPHEKKCQEKVTAFILEDEVEKQIPLTPFIKGEQKDFKNFARFV
jgi:membrane carboxypeptidase/penicillin-binding protein PbpC